MTDLQTPNSKLQTDREAEIITQLYQEAQQGMRRVVALGVVCFQKKAVLAHGEFQPWLEANCPTVGYKSIAAYMQITEGIFEMCGLPVGDYLQKSSALDFSHRGELFLAKESEVPREFKALRDKALAIIDGQSQRSIILKLKSNGMLGGFHPPQEDLIAWLKANHADWLNSKLQTPNSKLSFADLPAELQAAFKAQWKPKPIPASVRAEAAAARFVRAINILAATFDEKDWVHASEEQCQEAKELLRDYYRCLSERLKGRGILQKVTKKTKGKK